MKKNILLALFFLVTLVTQSQVLVKMSPKADKPKVTPVKPKTVVKTKIVYVEKPAKQKTVVIPKTNIEPEMVFVEGGTFTMGSTVEKDETPHSVTLSSFKMGKYEVTVGQYKNYCTDTGTAMPETPSWGWVDSHPIVNVNYNDATAYCNWLGDEYGGDWSLPTEAQWEYAARGGNKSNNYIYSGSNELDEVAWYQENPGGKTQTVGRKKPNELGIYDMSGNVWEWCKDWYGYYSATEQYNPKGATISSYRIFRGGSWVFSSMYSRVAFRSPCNPASRNAYNGFRVVLSQ
jgi:formylglycine-generating enzyme required for sulfatase activity